MIRIVVVFPAPFEPRNPKIWPGWTTNPTPSSAWTCPNRLRSPSTTSIALPRSLAGQAASATWPWSSSSMDAYSSSSWAMWSRRIASRP